MNGQSFHLCAPVVAATIVALTYSNSATYAAEIGCASLYGEAIPEERARTLWPSGARPTAETCTIAFIRGSINIGDYEKILALYRKNHPFLNQVAIDSPGGVVDDAIKIGRLFRKYLVTAVSPSRYVIGGNSVTMSYRAGKYELCGGPDCICASSCALIWFGAPERTGDIGLHRPRTDDPSFKALAPAEASRVYRRMLDAIVRYLEEMETPRPLIDAMVSTSSAEIHWFDPKVSGDRAPSFAEWLDASCGKFTARELDKMMELQVKRSNRQPLSETEQLLYNLLSDRHSKKTMCEIELVSRHRDKLSSP